MWPGGLHPHQDFKLGERRRQRKTGRPSRNVPPCGGTNRGRHEKTYGVMAIMISIHCDCNCATLRSGTSAQLKLNDLGLRRTQYDPIISQSPVEYFKSQIGKSQYINLGLRRTQPDPVDPQQPNPVLQIPNASRVEQSRRDKQIICKPKCIQTNKTSSSNVL